MFTSMHRHGNIVELDLIGNSMSSSTVSDAYAEILSKPVLMLKEVYFIEQNYPDIQALDEILEHLG